MVGAVVQLLLKATELSDFNIQMVYLITQTDLGTFKLGQGKLR